MKDQKFDLKNSEDLIDPNDAVVVLAALCYQLGGSITLCRESIMSVISGPIPFTLYVSDVEGDKVFRIDLQENDG